MQILYLYFNEECDSEKQKIKYSFYCTFLLGLATHAFGFLNLCPAHDSLAAFFNDMYGLAGWQMALGRILQPLYYKLTVSYVLLPWLDGILPLVWIALSVYLVSIIFNLKNKWQIFLLAGIFVTNRTIIRFVADYEPFFGSNILASLFAVVSVFLWHQFLQKKQLLYFCTGVLSLTLSMGLYQCYIAVTITLMILYSIISLLENETAKTVFKNGMFGIAMIGCGGILYYILMKCICEMNDIQLTEGGYNSLSNLWSNTEPFFNRIIACYKQVFLYFTNDFTSLYSNNTMLCINVLLGLICIDMFFWIIVNKRIKWIEICMIILLVVLLPMGANIIRLLNTTVYDLMVYAIWILYMLPILLWQLYYKCKKKTEQTIRKLKSDCQIAQVLMSFRTVFFGKKLLGLVCSLFLFFIIFSNIRAANTIYVNRKIAYDSTVSVMTNVLYDIERQENYIEGETPVVFIGTPGDFLSSLPFKDKFPNIASNNTSITYSYDYFFTLIGRKINMQSTEELENSETVQNMPSYPKNGSIKQLNGTIIVKFKK